MISRFLIILSKTTRIVNILVGKLSSIIFFKLDELMIALKLLVSLSRQSSTSGFKQKSRVSNAIDQQLRLSDCFELNYFTVTAPSNLQFRNLKLSTTNEFAALLIQDCLNFCVGWINVLENKNLSPTDDRSSFWREVA